ncbi:phosphotransferase family protein [Mycobacterium palustre]|uniref:Phosphotransferase n=1 Tax=Mycobacterium palustre TaxID=153971 RepID=A0A1X1ZJU3_9MYCO|nr:phosphotransferase family protein [Mycobacterium palustre]MCV7102848.1 phosphotransferase family protein [Mycobacterium palustre]ORW23627.1 phosphotransferase [Mycobacterium palustre]
MALQNVIDTELAAERLAGWLQSKWPRARDITVTDVLIPGAGGLSNETVLFTASWVDAGGPQTRGMVARVQPVRPGVFPEYDLNKEATVITALADHSDVPVPAVYFFEDDPSVFGAPFLVMQRIDGRIPADDPPFTATGWVLDLTPDQRRQMWHNSIDVLAQIHSVDWRALGLEFLDSPGNQSGLDAGLAQWRRTFDWAAEGEPNPTLEAALHWLDEHRPNPDQPKVLNWGDARVGNIIFSDDLAPAGVLDWEMVALASREQDLGWWLFLMRHHTEGVGLPLPAGIPDREETIDYYQRATGHTLRHLDYYEVLAGTRLAILMVRAAHMMIDAGLLPPDSPMAQSNPASQLVAKLLDLPAPAGTTTSFIGNRGH